jgi:hypothetical protein
VPERITGKGLFALYGRDVLGPWGSQSAEVQQAWAELAGRVSDEVSFKMLKRYLTVEEAQP